MNHKLKLFRIFFWVGILIPLIIMVIGYYFVLPRIIDFDKYESKVRAILNKRIIYPLDPGDLNISLTWNLRARISSNKVVLTKHDGSSFLKSGGGYVEVPIIPLINNRVILKKISINTLDADITRLENGKFDIAGVLALPEKSKYKVSLDDTEIIVNGYRINFIEKYIQPSQKYYLVGEKIKVKDFKPGEYIDAYALGKVIFRNKPDAIFDVAFSSDFPLFAKENLFLKGKITNLEPDVLLPYINAVSSIKFLSLAGKGDIKFDLEFQERMFDKNNFFIESNFDGIRIKTDKNGLISNYDGKISLDTRGHYNNSFIYFDNLKVKGAGINIKTHGGIKNYRNFRKHGEFADFRMNFTDTKAEPIARLFPKVIKLKRNHFKNILKHKVKAEISGNIGLKGNRNSPLMYGTINYSNLTLLGGFKNAPPASGNIDFIGPALVMKNKVFIGKDNFVKVTGKVNPFNKKKLNLDITSNEIDFARAQKILLILTDFFKMKLGPVPDMQLGGKGRANLNIIGEFNDAKINGYIEAIGSTLKYKTLSAPAYNLRGKLRFADRKVIYDDITGVVQGQKVIPTGYSNFDEFSDVVIHIPQLKLDRGLVFVNTSPLLWEVKQALKDVLGASGTADAKIHLKGTEEDLNSDGKFILKGASVLYKGFGGWFKNIQGPFEFINEDVYFKGTTAEVNGSKVKVSGYIKGNFDSDLKIISDSLNLNSAKDFLMASPILEDVPKVLDDYTQMYGTTAVEVNLKGNLKKDPLKNLVLKDMNAVFSHSQIGVPVVLNKGVLEITQDKVIAYDVMGVSEEISFKIDGNVSNLEGYIEEGESIIPNFTLKIDKLELSKAKSFIGAPILPKKVGKILSDFDQFHGNAELYLEAKAETFSLKFIPDGISAIYKPYDTFVLIKDGVAEFSDNDLELSAIKGVFSESDFNINGFVKNYKKEPEFDLAVNIDINNNDMEKLRFYSDIPVSAGGIIPFSIALNGSVEDWNVFGRMVLEKGSYLNYITDIGLPRDKVRLITLDARGSKDRLSVERLRIDVSDTADKVVRVSKNNKNYEGFKNLINIHGVIDELKSKKPVFKDFVIKTNDKNSISTKLFNPSIGCLLNNGCRDFFSRGDFKTDVKLNGYIASPRIDGNTTFQDITIPDYNAYIKTITLTFDKDTINLDIIGLNIGESKMNLYALVDTKFEAPVLIKDLQIDSRMFNLDELAKILPKGNNRDLPDLPPFVITNGTLKADELVVRDLITNNIRAHFNFTPDWLLSISKIDIEAAGGTGTGNVYYNFNTNELSANFNVRQMQANALVTTLLTIPNEVYGTLTGDIQFSTRGKTHQELIANSNGYAEFEAYKGRFVRLGSLEYFLRAVNVIQSGVGGFNINNIIDLVAPQKTGHFETLKGRVYARDGVLYTDDITSSGKNLSLYISGELDMLTNQADIQVLGRLSKKISGLLGPVGSVTINQFIDYIPGLGFLPATPERKGVVDLIPALSRIPGLELNNDQKYRRFVVQINGDLYDQSSVKSFRWIE